MPHDSNDEEDRRTDDRPDREASDTSDHQRGGDREGQGPTRPFDLDIGGYVGTLLEFLDEASERAGRSGREVRSDRGRGRRPASTSRDRPSRFAVDIDASVGALGDARTGRARDRHRRRVADATGEHLTTVRHDGETVVVTANLPGVDASDITVGVTDDRRTLVVRTPRETLARVPIERWDASAVQATLNNYVLEVRIDDSVVAGDPDEVISR
ncbi:GvpH protein [Natronoarchaeum philippinense]|uniref:GvpH protein n=1 Tax=Natronoarchaeum philippinense TaxID=558529 RepID=A0A285NWJ2_NATPI|nr:Hsp20/alpha crystallin family protein [Natronoarchaeum philippinense]SNZ13407.1 GvpH protein [Natronoarchaeum philippinense]